MGGKLALSGYQEWLQEIGRNIAAHRCRLKLTQKKLAERCGFDLKFYQDLEYGKRPFSSRTFYQLAVGLGISISELVTTPNVFPIGVSPSKTRGRKKKTSALNAA